MKTPGSRLRTFSLVCLLLMVDVSCGETREGSSSPPPRTGVTASGSAITGTLVARLGMIKFEGSGGDLIAFGPDRKTLVMASRGSAVSLWDVASGRQRATIECGHKSIWGWALAPNGAEIATFGFDGGVRVHTLASGKEVLAIPAQGSTIAAAFSPDATMLAYAVQYERTVHLVDAATGGHGRSLPIDNYTNQIAFSPDGRTLAVEVSGELHLHDVASGQLRLTIPGDVLGSRFAWSRDGKFIARVDNRGSLRIVDPTTGADRVPELNFGLGERGRAVAFSPDGSLLAVGFSHDADGPVLFLVDTKSGQKKAVGIERRGIASLAFSDDGSVLATIGDGGIRLWSVPDGRDLARVGHESAVEAAAFSTDGSTLATGSADAVQVWRTTDWKLAGTIDVSLIREKAECPQLGFARDGSLATIVGSTVAFWEPAKRTLARTVHCEGERPELTSLAAGAQWLVAGRFKADTDTPEVVRFDLEKGKDVWSVTPRVAPDGGSMQGVLPFANISTALAVAPDGKTIAAAFHAGEVFLLDAGSGRTERTFTEKRKGPVLTAAFSPDGRTLALHEINRPPELWDVATGQRRCEIGSRATIITGPSFSHDGKLIAASEPNGSISFFDVATCAALGNVSSETPSAVTDYPQVLTFSPSDAFLVSGHLDHTARVWRLTR